jgi:protein TonB
MKKSDKESSKNTSYLGWFFSIALHASVLVLILFWGFSGTSEYKGSPGPIQVSLSSLGTGGDAGKTQKRPQRIAPKKPAPQKVEKKEEPVQKEEPVKKEEVKAPPEPPKKEEPPKEPEKEEVKKEEVVKKEPEKKEVIPLEEEKKEEEKPKKEEKKVAEKPKPTEKPKPKPKPEKKTAKKKKSLDKERNQILKDIQRKQVLDQIGGKEAEPEEPMGQEQRLAMADDESKGLESATGASGSAGSSEGGSSASPVIINLYSQQVHRKISRNWRIPPSVPTDGGLETLVLFKVGPDGKIYDVRVSESSGNPVFDEYCVKAVYNSAPLPPPPSELAKEAKNDGVILTFRNES